MNRSPNLLQNRICCLTNQLILSYVVCFTSFLRCVCLLLPGRVSVSLPVYIFVIVSARARRRLITVLARLLITRDDVLWRGEGNSESTAAQEQNKHAHSSVVQWPASSMASLTGVFLFWQLAPYLLFIPAERASVKLCTALSCSLSH